MNNRIFLAANNTVPYHNLVDDLNVKRGMSLLVVRERLESAR